MGQTLPLIIDWRKAGEPSLYQGLHETLHALPLPLFVLAIIAAFPPNAAIKDGINLAALFRLFATEQVYDFIFAVFSTGGDLV
jgi:hypothetical protein